MNIPFNKPYMTGREIEYLKIAHNSGKLSGDGDFTKKCQSWLETQLNVKKALLTQSCTAALEMAAILIDVQPGDEIIMPSYTFVSTANAFVLRGGVPVFVDIRADTLNIDESKIEAAITHKTKAIVPVHYAGIACEMDRIMEIAQKYNLFVIEDAAQGIMSKYKDKSLGSIGHFGTLSFHETKNIISGEGGALLINDESFIEEAYIIWEKGTNRKQFFQGFVDKYSWVNIGSSYLPSELTAAFLWAQLEEAQAITEHRQKIWNHYHHAFYESEFENYLTRPVVPPDIVHNAHIYYILVDNYNLRTELIANLSHHGINAIFHYIPLHTSSAGKKFGRCHDKLVSTLSIADRIIRVPLFIGITEDMIDHVASTINDYLQKMFLPAKAVAQR